MRVLAPRPDTRQVNCPCTSAQIRTQRKQRMQRFMSTLMYGCDVSRGTAVRRGLRLLDAVAAEESAEGRVPPCPARRARALASQHADQLASQSLELGGGRLGPPCRRRWVSCTHVTGRSSPPTSTTQMRQAPDGAIRGSWQTAGRSTPMPRTASRIEWPMSTSCVTPSIVTRGTQATSSGKWRTRLSANAANPVPWPHKLAMPSAPHDPRERFAFGRVEVETCCRGRKRRLGLDAPDAARGALPTRLVRAEPEHLVRELDDRCVGVEADHATVAERGSDRVEVLEGQRARRRDQAG